MNESSCVPAVMYGRFRRSTRALLICVCVLTTEGFLHFTCLFLQTKRWKNNGRDHYINMLDCSDNTNIRMRTRTRWIQESPCVWRNCPWRIWPDAYCCQRLLHLQCQCPHLLYPKHTHTPSLGGSKNQHVQKVKETHGLTSHNIIYIQTDVLLRVSRKWHMICQLCCSNDKRSVWY